MGDIYKELHRKTCLSGEEEYTAGIVHDFLEDIKNQLPQDVFSVVDNLHTIALMTAVKALVQAKERWNGTLIACFQPGEESGKGAQGLISAGLYGIPTPDYVFGGHVTPEKAGTVSLTRGVAYSRSDSWKITMNGIGGHGLRPEATVDPITMACYAVTRLQTVVSRVVPSQEAGVLTVGQISRHSREYHSRICIHQDLKNGDEIPDHIASVFSHVFGEENFTYPVPGSEDFAVLARSPVSKGEADIPYCYWRYGSTDQERWDTADGKLNNIPSNHNSNFYRQMLGVEIDPLRVGTKALCAAALSKFILH